MQGFRERLSDAVSNSPIYCNDIWKLSRDAGLADETLYSIIHNQDLDRSSIGPDLFTIARVAALLDVSMDYLIDNEFEKYSPKDNFDAGASHILASLNSQVLEGASPLSTDKLLRTYKKCDGKMAGFTKLLPYCDQYKVPEPNEDHLVVKSIGKQSLSAITMGSAEISILQDTLDKFRDSNIKKDWMSGYKLAAQHNTHISIEELDVQMPNQPIHIKLDYIRCLLRVSDPDLLLNFSILIL